MSDNVKSFVCIRCPIGCQLTVNIGKEITVTGNTCKRGYDYAVSEVTNPTRIVTATALLIGGTIERAPVKTDAPIPKGMMMDVMAQINALKLTAPVKIGDIAIENVLGTGSNIVITRNIDAAY